MWAQIALDLLKFTIEKATPDIREKLKQKMLDWEKDAKATTNPFDDVLVFAVRILLGT